MSHHTPPSDPETALEFFETLLSDSPETCSWCFAKIKDRHQHDTDTLGTGNRPDETIIRSHDGELGYKVRHHDRYGARKSYHPATFCSKCGAPAGEELWWDRSLQEMQRHGDHIVRRLHEAGFYPDISALYDSIESLKSNPDYQGRDLAIFAAAVWVAVKRGRTRPGLSPPMTTAFSTVRG